MTDTASPLHPDLAAELAELGRVEVTPESMARVWERVQGATDPSVIPGEITMQRLSELTQAELANFNDEQIDYLIELEAAHQGVPAPPPRPLSPTEQEPKPTTTVYTVAGTELTDKDEAQSLNDYIQGLGSTVQLQYASGPSYKQYISDGTALVSFATKSVYTKAEYEQHKSLLLTLGTAKQKYADDLKAYEEAESRWQAVADEVRDAVCAAYRHVERKSYLLGKYNRYLELSDGQEAVARSFFNEAYPGEGWALNEDDEE